jgi:hypothetical protein
MVPDGGANVWLSLQRRILPSMLPAVVLRKKDDIDRAPRERSPLESKTGRFSQEQGTALGLRVLE